MWERGRGRSIRVQKGREGRGVRVVGMGGVREVVKEKGRVGRKRMRGI